MKFGTQVLVQRFVGGERWVQGTLIGAKGDVGVVRLNENDEALPRDLGGRVSVTFFAKKGDKGRFPRASLKRVQ